MNFVDTLKNQITLPTIPRFQLPGLIGSIGRLLPQWPHAVVLVTALNTAVRLKLLPVDDLARLEGKWFRITVRDTGGEANFTFSRGMFKTIFRPDQTGTQAPDLAFSGNLSTYLQLLSRQEDPDTLFFNRELEITGDTELGLMIKNMLDAVEFPELPGIFKQHG